MKEFIISEAKVETAVLVGLITQMQDERKTNEYLDELAFLAETAGAEAVSYTHLDVYKRQIKRSEKSLGYAVSSVKGDEITKARESNVLNSLSGKIAGLQIAQSSGTVGGSSSIQIRGASSIGTVSSPLFIIDGLPIDNGSYNPDRTDVYKRQILSR